MLDPHRQYIIGAHDDHTSIYRFDDRRLQRLVNLPFPPHAKSSLHEDGRFAILSLDGTSVSLGRIVGGNIEDLRDVSLGDDFMATCLAHAPGGLYLGGAQRDHITQELPSGIYKTVEVARPSVAVLDDSLLAPSVTVLDAPDFGRHRKWVDDLLVDDYRLIVIDNVVEPKFWFTYRLDEYMPKLDTHGMLASHGPYEQIKACAIGEGIVAILSHTSSGWEGYKHHLSIYDKDTMQQMMSLTLPNEGLKNTMCISGGAIHFAEDIGVIGRVNIAAALRAEAGETLNMSSAFTITGITKAEMMELLKRAAGRRMEMEQSRALITLLKPEALQTCGQNYRWKAIEEGRATDTLPPPIIKIKALDAGGNLVMTWVDNTGCAQTSLISASAISIAVDEQTTV